MRTTQRHWGPPGLFGTHLSRLSSTVGREGSGRDQDRGKALDLTRGSRMSVQRTRQPPRDLCSSPEGPEFPFLRPSPEVQEGKGGKGRTSGTCSGKGKEPESKGLTFFLSPTRLTNWRISGKTDTTNFCFFLSSRDFRRYVGESTWNEVGQSSGVKGRLNEKFVYSGSSLEF